VHLRENLLITRHLPGADPCHAVEPRSRSAASQYAQQLAEIAGSPPMLDLVHLGLGPDDIRVFGAWGTSTPCHDVDCGSHRVLSRKAANDIDVSIINPARRILWLATGNEKLARCYGSVRAISQIRLDDSPGSAVISLIGGGSDRQPRVAE